MCMCGDPSCPSCGLAQDTIEPRVSRHGDMYRARKMAYDAWHRGVSIEFAAGLALARDSWRRKLMAERDSTPERWGQSALDSWVRMKAERDSARAWSRRWKALAKFLRVRERMGNQAWEIVHDDLQRDYRRVVADLETARAVLHRAQWCQLDSACNYRCPVCQAIQIDGHSADCALGRVVG